MRSSVRLAVLALALLLPATAQADPKDDARRHFVAGLKAAQDGEFEIALQRFLAAQEAYPHPATLYNIARAYTDLNDLQNALTYYRLYREEAPDKAKDVDPVIQVLEARTGQSTQPTAPVTTAPTSGAVAGPTTVVVTGPTEEELARLSSIALELQALTEAIHGRRDAELAAAQQQSAVAEAGEPELTGPETGEGQDLPEIELPGGGFIDDAYEKIVVTASRVGQDPLDSPSTLTVLTEEDIRLSGIVALPDLLRRAVGVDAMSLTPGHSDISIRGFNRKLSNKVLVLVDGRSTYIDFIGVTFWEILPITLEEIERIEIIRGPGSAIYGANAVTGVINIITRVPGEGEGQLVKLQAGQPGLGRGTVLSSGRNGQTAWRLAANYTTHGRWAKEAEFFDKNGQLDEGLALDPSFTHDQDTAIDAVRGSGRIDQTFGEKGFASVSAGFFRGDVEFYNLGALPNYSMIQRNHFLRGDMAWGNVHLRTFWNSHQGDLGTWTEYHGQRTLDGAYDNDAVDIELESPIEFETGAVGHVLNLGTGYRYKSISFNYLEGDGSVTENHYNAFVNEQLSYKKVGVVGSMRVDAHPLLKIQDTLSPRLALLYRLFDKTSLRATSGTAFRAPNSLESYMDFNLPSSADAVYLRDVGDKNLRPERIQTFELGVRDESSVFHTADVVVYMNQVRDLIGLSSLEPEIHFFDEEENGISAGTTGWYNQPETYRASGLEAELDVYPTDGLDVFANFNLANIQETLGNNSVRDGATSAVKVNLGLMYRTPWRTDLTVTTHHYSAQTWRLREFDASGGIVINEADVPARTILSARAALRPFEDENLEVAGNLWNITELFGADRGIIEHPMGQPVIGRAYGELSYKF